MQKKKKKNENNNNNNKWKTINENVFPISLWNSKIYPRWQKERISVQSNLVKQGHYPAMNELSVLNRYFNVCIRKWPWPSAKFFGKYDKTPFIYTNFCGSIKKM